MDARGGTITWFLTANDADFNAAMVRTRSEARRTGRAVDRDFSRGMNSARLSLEDFRRDLGRSAQLFRDFQIALRGFQMTSLIIGVATAGGAIVELVGALTAATGAIYALPSVIASGIGAFGTWQTAIYGVGDAFKQVLKGDMEKLAEEMAKLSPQAQEFVKSFAGINEAFKPIRSAVQDAFFQDLGKQMESVAKTTLPVLKVGMLDVAKAMNGMAQEAARVAKEPFFQNLIATSLETTAKSTRILTGAVEPLAQALAGLVKIGQPYTIMLSEWLVSLSKSASEYINSAEGQKTLTDAINLGIDALKSIGSLIKAVFDLFVALFKVSNEEGLSLVGTLTDLINKTTDWVNSAEGSELMRSLFQATNTIFKELAETAGEFAVVLLEIIQAYNDLPGPLKDIVTHMIVWSALASPLITYASSLAASWRLVFFGLREVWQVAGLVITRLVAIKTGLTGIEIAQSSLSSFDKLKLAGEGLLQVVSRLAILTKAQLVGAFTAVASWFSTAAASGGILGTVLSGIATAARVAWAAITGPVGLVILAITAVVAGFVWLYNNVEGFRDFVNGVWAGIVAGAQAAGQWFAGPFVDFFTGAWEGIMAGAKAVGDFFAGVWSGIVTVMTPVVDAIKMVGQIIANGVIIYFNLWKAAIEAVINVVTTIIGVLQPLWDILGLIGYAFMGLAQIIWTIISTVFQVLWTIISTIVQIIGVILWGTLMKIGEAFMWVFNNAAAIVTAAFTIIQTVFTTVWGAIVAFFTPIIQFIANLFTTYFNIMFTIVSTVFNAIKSVVTTVFNAIAGFITTVWNGIMAFLSPILNVIANIFSTVFNAIARTVNTVFNLIKQYIINPISEVVGYVGRTIGQIAKFIGDAVTNAYNAVAGFVSKFVSAGKNIIDGIVQGIKNGAGAVTDFIKNVCSNALNAVKNFFGIKSPSRVMAGVGSYIMEGLGKGINSQADAVVGAAKDAASGVLGAFDNMSASIGSVDSNFTVNGQASGAFGMNLAPLAVDTPTAVGNSGPAAVIYQTNEVHTDLDMDQVNRNLTWELGKL